MTHTSGTHYCTIVLNRKTCGTLYGIIFYYDGDFCDFDCVISSEWSRGGGFRGKGFVSFKHSVSLNKIFTIVL